MLKIFDKENGIYLFPNGDKKTSHEIKDGGEYPLLFATDCAVDIVGEILKSYYTISELREHYGISDDKSAEEVIQIVNDQKSMSNASAKPTVSDTVLKAVSFVALSFTDEQALEVPDLYPAYEVDHAYKKDERFTYNGRLFKVNQAHTSAAQWVPGETGTESLYTCLEMAGDGYLVWTQPTGAHNAYNTGDIVHYPTADDPLYKSKIDGNTTVPGSDERWWEVYTGGESSDTETPTEPSTDPSEGDDEPETSYPDFVQPTGAHDAYKLGDIVKFNGQLYKSKIDNNVYSPEAYPAGWELYTE